MKESYLFDMSFNNVIFRGRNKAYGAYELRQVYSKHVLLSALLATTVFASGLGWPLLKPNHEIITTPTAKDPDEGTVTIIDTDHFLPPPKPEIAPEQPPVQPAEQNIKTIAHVPPTVVPDSHPDSGQKVPTVDQLREAVISTQTREGDAAIYHNMAVPEHGTATSGSGTEETDANAIHDFVAEMPYFEGGEEGLLKYISRKIKYPRQAVSEQIEGVVVVSFVVNRTGNISDATILKGLGFGTDEEALRVINGMPAWTPGKQNGKPVAVRYTLPIRFSMKR